MEGERVSGAVARGPGLHSREFSMRCKLCVQALKRERKGGARDSIRSDVAQLTSRRWQVALAHSRSCGLYSASVTQFANTAVRLTCSNRGDPSIVCKAPRKVCCGVKELHAAQLDRTRCRRESTRARRRMGWVSQSGPPGHGGHSLRSTHPSPHQERHAESSA
jgi:hypothetical protein